MNKPRTGRPRIGTLEPAGMWSDGSPRFRGRVRLGDGTKSDRFDVPHGLDAEQARAYVTSTQAQEDANGLLLREKREAARDAAAREREPHELESCDSWFKRYLPTKDCGDSHRRISASIWKKWISPVIGPKEMRTLTRDNVEDVRDKLDCALDAKEIRHSTARNAWAVLTGALKAAYAARDRSLRVLSTPLHFGILPPKRGESRQRPWLYPREWLAFVTCEAIPIAFRQACAVALYTGLRPGELRALLWSDVDLEARTISVSKALDAQSGDVKPPKTAQGQRLIPIHPNLVPLLEALEGEDDALVLGTFNASEDHMAQTFRDHLDTAHIERPRLTADNATEEPIDFRSLRDSHATWLALGGTPDKVIQRRMGHASPTTTDRYVKAAETFAAEHVGVPFPPIPQGLRTNVWTNAGKSPRIRRGKVVARVGFEPTTFGL